MSVTTADAIRSFFIILSVGFLTEGQGNSTSHVPRKRIFYFKGKLKLMPLWVVPIGNLTCLGCWSGRCQHGGYLSVVIGASGRAKVQPTEAARYHAARQWSGIRLSFIWRTRAT